MCAEYCVYVNMYHVTTKGVEERRINYYYYYFAGFNYWRETVWCVLRSSFVCLLLEEGAYPKNLPTLCVFLF